MLAAGIGPIGPIEGLIILAVVILIFGVGKLSDVGSALGKSIREFRKAAREPDDPDRIDAPHCTNCGSELGSDEKFCAKCGTPVRAAAG